MLEKHLKYGNDVDLGNGSKMWGNGLLFDNRLRNVPKMTMYLRKGFIFGKWLQNLTRLKYLRNG